MLIILVINKHNPVIITNSKASCLLTLILTLFPFPCFPNISVSNSKSPLTHAEPEPEQLQYPSLASQQMQLNMTQAGLAKCPKIRHIVHIRQMLKQWRKEARRAASSNKAVPAPSDVPAGHVAVCVGSSLRRFIVHATYLNHPIFKQLLAQTEEEFGFSNVGPLTIPCDEALFEEALWIVSRSADSASKSGRFLSGLEDFQRCCRVGMKKKLEFAGECRPLLHHLADKSAR